ncbi:hypothetical protein QR680_002884 [Steinernema hermaphroditum]|uniref:aECM cysteine-cradle domain-containing protein n=1 Tax=Steinernema hermaphroditum TaxID=289476 RepID=A0AA39LIZ7_9BILA|nr:hypothetical protein QR680_002884 [Steinernema hermaphroditum]
MITTLLNLMVTLLMKTENEVLDNAGYASETRSHQWHPSLSRDAMCCRDLILRLFQRYRASKELHFKIVQDMDSDKEEKNAVVKVAFMNSAVSEPINPMTALTNETAHSRVFSSCNERILDSLSTCKISCQAAEHDMHKHTVVLFMVIAVSILETESSQRLIDHYQRKLNNLQKKINTGKPVVINGKIKRYKCIEEYVSVDQYGNVIESESEHKNDVSYVKPRHISTTTSTPMESTTERVTKKLTIQHLTNTASSEISSDASAHRKPSLSVVDKTPYSDERIERLPATKTDEDEEEKPKRQVRRKESSERRFGRNRLSSGSDEDGQYQEYDDDYYVEDRPVLRRGRGRGLYRRQPAYYVPYERRFPVRRAYAGTFVNDNYLDNQVEPVTQMPMYRRNPLRQQALPPPLPLTSNTLDQEMTTPRPQVPGAGFTPLQRATQPPLAQPGFISAIINRYAMMPTTPKSSAFVQSNGIEDDDTTTQKPASGSMYKARGNYGLWDLQKPTPDTCKKIIHMAQLYNVPDVQTWIRHNCVIIQAMMIQAPCDVIFNFVDQCYKRKML